MFEVTIQRDFSAAHRVQDYPGNCEHLHGHNWRVEVTARSRQLDELGMVVDFRKLKEITDRAIAPLDHSLLNDLPLFSGVNPTTENIARHIFTEVSREISIHSVRVCETDSSFATYYGEGG